jgi:murein L,D-transpeptidase YcbB/YkuD
MYLKNIICFTFFVFCSDVLYSEKSKPHLVHKEISTIHLILEKLKAEKNKFEKLAESIKVWPQIPCLNIVFKKGMSDPTLKIVKEQLTKLEFFKASKIDSNKKSSNSHLITDEIHQAIKDFQKYHSLDVDGAYGPKTCKMLNLSPKTRINWIQNSIDQIEFLEKNKNEFQNQSILVNIPTFDLFALYGKTVEMIQPVIVGQPHRKTPLMTTPIVQVILNPSWGVPTSILMKDKIKKIKADDSYLERLGFHVLDADGIEIDPKEVNWDDVGPDDFNYHLRQQPGPKNALGNIKFALINNYAIYMHGTPDTNLFNKGQRCLSSGCVRVKDPLKLALWVLNYDAEGEAEVKEMLDSHDTHTVPIHPSINVHIMYIPVFVNDNAQVVFGSDPYGLYSKL